MTAAPPGFAVSDFGSRTGADLARRLIPADPSHAGHAGAGANWSWSWSKLPNRAIYGNQDGALRAPWAAMPRTCDFSPGLRGHAFGAPDRPAPPGMRARAQGSSRGSAGQPRVPQQTAGVWLGVSPLLGGGPAAAFALGTHGAGRRRSAVPPHPPPARTRRNATPGVRTRQNRLGVLPAPGDPVAGESRCQGRDLRPSPSASLRADP